MKKVTLSLGIPAHNEERNITNIIKTIQAQKQKSYKLENIYIVCDGCTDNTVEIVKKLAEKDKQIKLTEKLKRAGKVEALNIIYKSNKSDFIMTIDADLVFANKNDLEELVKVITKNKSINVVGPRHIPVQSPTVMGKFAVISYLSFEDAFLKINKGNCFYASMGAYMLRRKFSKSLKYPPYAQADQTILFAMATRKTRFSKYGNKEGFKLVRKAQVYFRTVSTFRDWRILGIRSAIADKANTASYFGEDILSEYYMPRRLFIFSLIKWFFRSPFYTFGSVLMNIYIRKFPLKSKMPKKGMWEIAYSSKEAISI